MSFNFTDALNTVTNGLRQIPTFVQPIAASAQAFVIARPVSTALSFISAGLMVGSAISLRTVRAEKNSVEQAPVQYAQQLKKAGIIEAIDAALAEFTKAEDNRECVTFAQSVKDNLENLKTHLNDAAAGKVSDAQPELQEPLRSDMNMIERRFPDAAKTFRAVQDKLNTAPASQSAAPAAKAERKAHRYLLAFGLVAVVATAFVVAGVPRIQPLNKFTWLR